MTLNVDWTQAYPIAEAERSRFVYIDPSTIPGYLSLSSGTLSGYFRGKKYAVLTYPIQTEPISTVPLNPNTMVVNSSTYNALAYQVNYDPQISYLEFFNNSNSYTYLILSATDYATTTALGIPIFPNTLYTIVRNINTITFAPISANTNLRIMGHYR